MVISSPQLFEPRWQRYVNAADDRGLYLVCRSELPSGQFAEIREF